MGSKTHIRTQYHGAEGRLVSDSGAITALGTSAETFAPYELLLGGLSFCLYSTFESVAEKMRLAYKEVEIHVTGVKRDEPVATLETCELTVSAKGVDDQAKFTRAFEISTRYCSVYHTISKVAKMSWTVTFG
jgi:putative redox protein